VALLRLVRSLGGRCGDDFGSARIDHTVEVFAGNPA
jgi:hypothetical protein